jgi:hypothetical protein
MDKRKGREEKIRKGKEVIGQRKRRNEKKKRTDEG